MVAQLRPPTDRGSVRRLSLESWRLEGCDHRCRATRVIEPGVLRTREFVMHDPNAHEEYGHLLASQVHTVGRGIVRTGGIAVDHDGLLVRVDGDVACLTPKELHILLFLSTKVGRTVPQIEIIDAVWGGSYTRGYAQSEFASSESHLLRVHASRLRGKLGRWRHLVETRPGVGYTLLLVSSDDRQAS